MSSATYHTTVNPPVVIQAEQSTVVPIISGQVLTDPRSSTPPTEFPDESTDSGIDGPCLACIFCVAIVGTIWFILSIFFTITGNTSKSYLWNPGIGVFVGCMGLFSCCIVFASAGKKPKSVLQNGPSSEPFTDGQRRQGNVSPLTRLMQSQDNVTQYSGSATPERGNQESPAPLPGPFTYNQQYQGYVADPYAPPGSTVFLPVPSDTPPAPQNPHYGSGITYPSTTTSTINGFQNNNWQPPSLPGTESFTAPNAPPGSTVYSPVHSDIPPPPQNPDYGSGITYPNTSTSTNYGPQNSNWQQPSSPGIESFTGSAVNVPVPPPPQSPYYGSDITYPSTTPSTNYGPQNSNWQPPTLPGTESFRGASSNVEPPPYEPQPYGLTPYEPPKYEPPKYESPKYE